MVKIKWEGWMLVKLGITQNGFYNFGNKCQWKRDLSENV